MVRYRHRLNGHDFEPTLEIVKDRAIWHTAVHGVTKLRHNLVTEQQHVKKNIISFLPHTTQIGN